jgi:CheY-like chemotaxis protein
MKPRILIMDDDAMICRIYVLMLDRLGYVGETVTTGEQVLKRVAEAREAGQPFAAVILDLTVKDGMGGLDTVRELRKQDPSVHAIMASGAARDAVLSRYAEQGFNDVLPKPFRMQDVADCLQRIQPPPQP